MTRRTIIFKDADGMLYASAEFNGDKRQFEIMGSMDSCDKNWEDILPVFQGVTTSHKFVEANRQAQKYYHSFLGEVEILPIYHISSVDEPLSDRIYFLEQGEPILTITR